MVLGAPVGPVGEALIAPTPTEHPDHQEKQHRDQGIGRLMRFEAPRTPMLRHGCQRRGERRQVPLGERNIPNHRQRQLFGPLPRSTRAAPRRFPGHRR